MIITSISIDTINLSARAVNALHRIGVHTVGDLLPYTEEQLYQVQNLGRKSVEEILRKIEEYKMLEETGLILAEPKQEYSEEAIQVWFESDAGKNQVLQWLKENQIRVDTLELLSAKAYNSLMLNGLEQLHQLAFRTAEDLQLQIPRMTITRAEEIIKCLDSYMKENLRNIYQACISANHQSIEADNLRFMPEYQDSILSFVQKNDVSVENMPISGRPKNQLRRNGYHKLSDIIFLTEEQLRSIPFMGKDSADQILSEVRTYFKKYSSRLFSFCNGDTSALLDDASIRDSVLQLYRNTPFTGFSLQEMLPKLQLPADFPLDRIKKIIGGLLAEQKLEYVDFRCYRLYEKFETFLSGCDAINERAKRMLQLRLQGKTLEEIGEEYNVTRERVRQIIKKRAGDVRKQYSQITGDHCFDEDYYWYFYENYAFDRSEASLWMNIPESVWNYLEMMDVKQGKKDLESALEDRENLEVGLRLKIKNYLNRNKLLIDGVWIGKKRAELEPIVAKKFCQDEISFDTFAKVFNDFLQEEEIPYDEDLYYTDAVIRTRKNRLAECKFLLWKQNEMLRYYDIDSRDYGELIETLKLDAYENVEYSTLKFVREYPQLMKKYDIRDQYELHNLLRKIIPEGSLHDFHCGRTPIIKFGVFDRDAAILDTLMQLTPISLQDLYAYILQEYGYEPGAIPFQSIQPYYHNGICSIEPKVMSADRVETLRRALPDDFYYLDEVRNTYARLFPNADPEEINPYNLKSMGFIVLSRYVVQHHASLEAYCEYLLTKDNIVDLVPLRKRLTYVQMFSQKLMELKRNLDVIEFEPGQLLNFRKLAQAEITKEDIRQFCDQVYDFIPDGSYFTAQSLRANGFQSDLYDLGFSDWFYANLLLSDERLSYTNAFGNMILCKGRSDITVQSFLVDRICAHGWVDIYDLMTELADYYGCTIPEKSDITFKLKNSQIYHDKILDRLYANVDLYYRDLDEAGGF